MNIVTIFVCAFCLIVSAHILSYAYELNWIVGVYVSAKVIMNVDNPFVKEYRWQIKLGIAF